MFLMILINFTYLREQSYTAKTKKAFNIYNKNYDRYTINIRKLSQR